jgi:hypothetical protein
MNFVYAGMVILLASVSYAATAQDEKGLARRNLELLLEQKNPPAAREELIKALDGFIQAAENKEQCSDWDLIKRAHLRIQPIQKKTSFVESFKRWLFSLGIRYLPANMSTKLLKSVENMRGPEEEKLAYVMYSQELLEGYILDAGDILKGKLKAPPYFGDHMLRGLRRCKIVGCSPEFIKRAEQTIKKLRRN